MKINDNENHFQLYFKNKYCQHEIYKNPILPTIAHATMTLRKPVKE